MKILKYVWMLLWVTGCRELLNFSKDTLLRLQNETTYALLIETYGSGKFLGPNNPYYFEKHVKLDSVFIGKNNAIQRVVHPGDWDYHFSGETDSLLIFFGSKKKLIQSCGGQTLISISNKECDIPNNLLLVSNATVEVPNSGKYERIVTYKITLSDYDRAVDL